MICVVCQCSPYPAGHPLIETSSHVSPVESTGKGGVEQVQSRGSSRTTTQHPTKSEEGFRPNWEEESRLGKFSSGQNNAPGEDIDDSLVGGGNTRTPPPVLLPTPVKRFSREETVSEILDLTNQVASVALFGPIGIGKSFVARAVLHHNQTEARFGQNRHFIRCDDLTNSFGGFLQRLSDAICADRTASVAQLRSYLETSPPLLLLLDGVDLILDPQAPESEDIYSTIEEFGSYEHVCLVTTSRMHPDIRGFHRVEVATLSEDDARDFFHGLCDLPRSSAVDTLITRLDFHPLSIEHLASRVSENHWDDSTLLEAWDDDQTSGLKTSYFHMLKDIVEPAFCSPTISDLGTTARGVLSAIAAFPSGVKERELERIFHKITGIGEVVDVLCKFSFIHRQGGFVKMISPFRFYFLEAMLVPAQTEEVLNIRWGPDCMPAKACTPPPPPQFHNRELTLFLKGSPSTPPDRQLVALHASSAGNLIVCLHDHV